MSTPRSIELNEYVFTVIVHNLLKITANNNLPKTTTKDVYRLTKKTNKNGIQLIQIFLVDSFITYSFQNKLFIIHDKQ